MEHRRDHLPLEHAAEEGAVRALARHSVLGDRPLAGWVHHGEVHGCVLLPEPVNPVFGRNLDINGPSVAATHTGTGS